MRRQPGNKTFFLLEMATLALARLCLSQAAPPAAPVHIVEQAPVSINAVAPGVVLVDFGRVAFGNLTLNAAGSSFAPSDALTIRFGEALKDGRIDTQPPGSVRFAQITVHPRTDSLAVLAPPADARNTRPPAVLTPAAFGVLTPFRWVEIDGWPGTLRADQLHRRAAFDSTWVDSAATFHSSDPMLDRVWDLSHYSIKATTFAGLFVDGDRERISYEADAYLNQLGYYAGDADPRMPRATFDRLLQHPTWPTEWAPHMVFMARADWMETGDRAWLAAHYEALKTKLLTSRVGPDGLVRSTPDLYTHGDIVDWPIGERDGFVFTPVNTVVNAFHLQALKDMALLADALGKTDEAADFRQREAAAEAVFQQTLFDPVRGLYRDGIGTDHTSWHANAFPLAFGLVPADKSAQVAQWLAGRGMAGSVYAAQYLLEGLFEHGQDAAAVALITAPGDRSWRHMVDSGATITWEAWDQKYKPNQDWNHAWGAAPANLLPRFVLGAQAATPVWATARIQPHPGGLSHAEGTVPTPRGALSVSWTRSTAFALSLALPPGMTAAVELPAIDGLSRVLAGHHRVPAHRSGPWWVLDQPVSGTVQIEER